MDRAKQLTQDLELIVEILDLNDLLSILQRRGI
jgi:hypothetical protein